ncbi:hypothetical protein EV127DRAFT_165277 [Xylaria flabelliformis]|nr:hypothetical protein EV127DRAFT_165277 [Xylaria flabelliformis]
MASADDPPLYRIHDASVRQPLSPHPALPMTPPELDHDRALLHGVGGDVAQDLDKLVHRLNRKPIFQDSLRWCFLEQQARGDEGFTEEMEEEREVRYEGSNAFSTQMPMPMQLQPQPSEPTPALDPIPELSMQCDPCPSMLPPLCEPLQPPSSSYPFNSVVAEARPEEKLPCKPSDVKHPRRGMEGRLHKSASNLRMLGLVTGMIENGVQCNVHNSTPSSPTRKLSVSSTLPASMRHIEAQDPIEPHLLPSRLQLEVDQGFSELDEETLLNESLALRHAGTPAGIRKFGFLRYRSSSEAAQSCKNMKKSVPRMRRRRKPSTTPASESSTSQKPPPTAA